MGNTGSLFINVVEIMKKLRGKDGCPWDLEQTPDSIKKHLIEEAYEVVEALDANDPESFKEELGDLLLQIIFHAQMASENGDFDINGVLKALSDKLIRRHPHVFSDRKVKDTKEVLFNWEQIKKGEKNNKNILSRVPVSLPALLYAYTLQSKASRVGFDWEKSDDALLKIDEEIDELKDAYKSGDGEEEEIGDLLFSVVNFSRHIGIDPEEALRGVSKKFKKRFEYIERKIKNEGKSFQEFTLKELDKLWEEAKREKGELNGQN